MCELISPTLLPAEVWRTIATPHSIPLTRPPHPETGYWTYGLGTYLHTYRSHQALHHAGGLPGQYTYQLTLPEKGMAVLVFSNNDTYSAGINKIVSYGVMDALLRLDEQDGNWEKRVMDTWLAAPQIHIKTIQENDKDPIYDKSPEEAGDQEPDPDPKMAIIGTYEHPAYPPIAISPLSTSSPLRPYLQSIQDCCSMPLSLDRREICIAHTKSVFVDTILFTHHSGPFWEWVATKLYKVSGLGDKSDQCELVAPFVDGQGRCVVGKSGLGMGGDWWVSGGKQTREVSEGRTKGVEVWYTRTKA